MSNFPRFSVFSPCSRSYIVHFSFSTFFTVSRHIPGLTLSFSHFPSFSEFLALFHVIQYSFLIFHIFQCFLPYSRSSSVCVSYFSRFSSFLHYSKSYSVHFSFSMFCSVSCPIPDPKVSISHFPPFSVFLAIFQVIQCLCLIFHIFHFFRHTPGPTMCINPFSHFSVFLSKF